MSLALLRQWRDQLPPARQCRGGQIIDSVGYLLDLDEALVELGNAVLEELEPIRQRDERKWKAFAPPLKKWFQDSVSKGFLGEAQHLLTRVALDPRIASEQIPQYMSGIGVLTIEIAPPVGAMELFLADGGQELLAPGTRLHEAIGVWLEDWVERIDAFGAEPLDFPAYTAIGAPPDCSEVPHAYVCGLWEPGVAPWCTDSFFTCAGSREVVPNAGWQEVPPSSRTIYEDALDHVWRRRVETIPREYFRLLRAQSRSAWTAAVFVAMMHAAKTHDHAAYARYWFGAMLDEYSMWFHASTGRLPGHDDRPKLYHGATWEWLRQRRTAPRGDERTECDQLAVAIAFALDRMISAAVPRTSGEDPAPTASARVGAENPVAATDDPVSGGSAATTAEPRVWHSDIDRLDAEAVLFNYLATDRRHVNPPSYRDMERELREPPFLLAVDHNTIRRVLKNPQRDELRKIAETVLTLRSRLARPERSGRRRRAPPSSPGLDEAIERERKRLEGTDAHDD